jgi:RraA family protein
MAEKPKSAEMTPGPGFRVRRTINRPDAQTVAHLGEFESPDISDVMNRLYTMGSEIHNVTNEKKLIGPACTVKVFPGDNLMVHKALDIAQPGDVIVVDAGGSYLNGIVGDLITAKAMHRGLAGFVIDGLIRDWPGVKELGLPIYARGTTPIGPLHRGPGEVNFPVSCGGIVVLPGDIVVGDENGVTVVRADFAEEVLARLVALRDTQAQYVADVRKGVFSNAWVDRLLLEADCQFID